MEILDGHTGPIHCINTRHHMICSGGADCTVRVSYCVSLLIGCSYGIYCVSSLIGCSYGIYCVSLRLAVAMGYIVCF